MHELATYSAQPLSSPTAFLNPSVPQSLQSRLLWLPDESRNMGIHIMAGKGSGKSRVMGRLIAWLDFLRGIPVVIFDPLGTTIDNFLDKLTRLPKEIQVPLWSRVLYVDASGKSGWVIPMPLYFRLGNESHYEISQRYLDVIRKLDPNLQSASVEGWNPLWRIGTAAGMILSALNLQITEAEDLIRDPLSWEERLRYTLQHCPELSFAISVIEDLAELKPELAARRSESYLNKIAIFAFDPTFRAMYGAGKAGFHWPEVIDHATIVLLDFRGEQDIERRRFGMVWAFTSLLSFIKYRGAGRHRPISVIIDELTSLFSPTVLAGDLFASELDELINVIARNCMIWLTIAHQELFQLSEHAQKTLMAMGTQMLGVTSDRDAATHLARQFFRYDPYWIKKREPVYSTSRGIPNVIDYRTVEFSIEEQMLLQGYDFTSQGRFHFLVRTAPKEGEVAGPLQSVSIARFDQNLYTNEKLVAQARDLLMEKRGRRVGDILAEIDARLSVKNQLPISQEPMTLEKINTDLPPEAFATIENDGHSNDTRDERSQFGEKKTAAASDQSHTE